MPFLSQRLPTQVEIGAVARVVEDIEIVTTDGSWEVRNARHSQPLRRFDISFPTDDYDGSIITAVKNQFAVARGPLYPFRFQDWSDYKLEMEPIGTGNGVLTTFQIIKTYASGSDSHVRPITRPVSPIQVYKNAVLQVSGYSVDYTTGIITFSAPVTNGHVVAVNGEFDVPVRFDPELAKTGLAYFLEHLDTFTLYELREGVEVVEETPE